MKKIVFLMVLLYNMTILNAGELSFDSMKKEYMANREAFKNEGTIKLPSGKLFYWRDIFELAESQQRDAWDNFMKMALGDTSRAMKKEMKVVKAAIDYHAKGNPLDPKYKDYINTKKEVESKVDYIVNDYSLKCHHKEAFYCNQVANMLFAGDMVEEDKNHAKYFYKKGCQYGSGNACFTLGRFYHQGKTKLRLYEKSCQMKYYQGCVQLGYMYTYGKSEVVRNKVKAKEYFQKACNKKVKLGCVYYRNLKKKGYAD